ncbi:DNA-binding domain-containing protein [Tropicimonas sp. IMCC6043]|uniref:HvfC/BufC N-terminal domain-containing protein n=1 Tax=Tropicimonas sp. IMCC6043 TaxID=2510645 RepID=UPI00101BB853|nr:DNA-binding domain-containing protein [Tropicimonas sp. IMCC6043]RYH11199.1 DUF2063 domain-containing protein [Tropicimonas sp. IMCC6043]
MSVVQTDFRAAILDPARPAPAGLVDPEGRPAGKRFDVYRNNVVVSLTNALAEAFPVIRKLLGENNFSILAHQFVRAHPPDSPRIALYGGALPAFLEGFEPVRHLGYLPDVARLEHALRESYHAADVPAVDPAALAALPPDRLLVARLTLAPTLRWVASDWPIAAIWHFNATGGPKPAMQAETALVTRPDFDPVVTALSPAGGAFVSNLAAGERIGAAIDAATARAADFDLAATLAALVSGGAITAIEED